MREGGESVTFCFIHPLTESNHCSTCLGKSHWTKIEETEQHLDLSYQLLLTREEEPDFLLSTAFNVNIVPLPADKKKTRRRRRQS